MFKHMTVAEYFKTTNMNPVAKTIRTIDYILDNKSWINDKNHTTFDDKFIVFAKKKCNKDKKI